MRLPEPRMRWGMHPVTLADPQDNEYALRCMCNYGAEQVAGGKADALELRVDVSEVEYVRQYMKERHPTVPFVIC